MTSSLPAPLFTRCAPLGVAIALGSLGCNAATASPPPSQATDDAGGGAISLGDPNAPAPDAGASGRGSADASGIAEEPDGAQPDDAGVAEEADGARPNDAGKGASSDGGTAGGALSDASAATGLHVVLGSGGSPGHIVDASGKAIQLHGVDRSGTEFECVSGAFADGPIDQAGIDAMKSWNVNAVRVPLNEDCWLGINGVPSAYSGASYQSAIAAWVSLLTSNGMVVILDMHWTAPGSTVAKGQAPMADADHTPTAWGQIAKAFAGNGLVIFDLFNEPFITDWGCWVSGGSCAQSNGTTYTVAGMAQLLQAVRGAGASNVVILGGLSYASDMSKWVSSVNSIPTLAAPLNGIGIENIAASWHAYDFNSEQSGCPSQYNGYGSTLTCNSAAATATNTAATSVLSAGFPLVLGEVGISAYSASSAASFSTAQITDIEGWLDNLLDWAEGEGQGYLAWSWNTDTTPVLVTDYAGTPTVDFGQTYQAHLKKY
jgi:endoglucanase